MITITFAIRITITGKGTGEERRRGLAAMGLTLADFPPLWLRGMVVALGLLFGSFLNVVIHRVPRGMSVVRPPSHCPACNAPIRAWQNVPVFGWLVLRGRAACCGAKISPRYPLVE